MALADLIQKTANSGIRYWISPDTTKPALIFIHGFTGNHEGFQYLVPLLTDFTVIVPDLPGFGESPLEDDGWSIEGIAQKTNHFVTSLKLSSKPFLISHSMGTLMAASMLEQNPELFQTKTIFISPVPTKVRIFDSRKIGAVLGSLQYRIGSIPKLGPALVKSHRLTKAVTSLMVTTKDRQFRTVINNHHINNLLYISDIRFYHKIHTDINKVGIDDKAASLAPFDVLFIVGDKDNVTPLRKVKKAGQHIGAELVIMPGVGHLAHYETPELIISAIREFLQ